MRMLEEGISEKDTSNYRRQCMRSKGYVMDNYCYIKDYTVGSCFLPRWVFWMNTVDF
jgi:hypothetical protein